MEHGADANDGSVIVAAYAGKHDIARFLLLRSKRYKNASGKSAFWRTSYCRSIMYSKSQNIRDLCDSLKLSAEQKRRTFTSPRLLQSVFIGARSLRRFLASKANVDAWIAFDPFLSEVLDAEA